MDKLLTKKDIHELLANRFSKDFHTRLSLMPSPMLFKDMKKAVLRLKKAHENGQSIAIVGDYDADGVIASVIMSQFFDMAGIKHTLYIPNRFKDGYGLDASIVERLDTDVIITVDNGITAVDAANVCKEQGKDLIITDHHAVGQELPNAYAIVNPKQSDCEFPCSEICGAQVAWYFCAALKEVCGFDIDMSYWLDLLAIAIMADMMELRDLNRLMTKQGIKRLNSKPRASFVAVKDFFNKNEFKSDDISFLLAPLINSAGRMDDAMISFRFLNAQTYDEAMVFLEEIVDLNNLRKKQESELFNASLSMVKEGENIIVVWGEDWHEGVVGIVASRLSRRFKKPAIVFSVQDGRAKGSARSVGEIDILSIISQNSHLLLGFGGHKGAAGVSIEEDKLPLFKEALQNACKNIEPKKFRGHKEILGEIKPSEIDFELLSILKKFEPYGEKNPRPSFLIKGIDVKTNRLIGKEQNHLKLILNSQNSVLESLFFNFDKKAKAGDKIDILFTVSENNYRGLVTPQLLIQEIL